MKKTEAERLVINTFTHAFSEERFTQFVRNLLPDLQPASTRTVSNAQLPQGFRENVHNYIRLGTYQDPQGDVLDVVVVKLKQQDSLDRARTRQRNLMAHYLNKRSKDAVLVAYITDDPADWRFSFVKLAYQTEITSKGTVKVKKDFTPARRYSFLVGEHEPNHTAQKQLSVLLMSEDQPTIGQIEEAFSIESVTKEFFENYRSLFLQIKENVDQIETSNQKVKNEFQRCEIDTTNFAKKLLGQIVFLYFLQKKGWLGVAKNDAWGTGDKKFLSNLFKNNKKRNFFDDVLEPFFYEALAIERKGDYYSALECKIPFLNGGLFEPLHGYDWENIQIGLSNQVFEDVFRVFNRYNFTVREDEPLEKEVAVDPEMLGKVFENLLEIKDRKSKGAFYTPREIVHFMCQESLINYLDTALDNNKKKVDKGDIETFIREGDLSIERDRARAEGKLTDDDYGLPDSIRKYAEEIDFALSDIKICDPAVGSGAFLVGMMTEIVRARSVLTAYLNNRFNRDAYTFKWRCIENNLYGVDVDASAVEIAKLRLWLSLVVDEESYDQIRPLPNLDYRIVCGNSLQSVQLDLFNYKLYPELEKKKFQYFSTTSPKNKAVLRKEIEGIINKLTNGRKLFDFKVYFSEVFSGLKRFDVVIGNPPYGANLSPEEKNYLKVRFKDIVERIRNSFLYFTGLSYELVKTHGIVCLIIPNEFLFQIYMTKARRFFLEKTRWLFAINVGDDVFEAVIPACIIAFKKEEVKNYQIPVADFRDLTLKELSMNLATEKFARTHKEIIKSTPNSIVSFDTSKAKLVSKLSSEFIPFEVYCTDIANGISTSCDEIYIVSNESAQNWSLEEIYLKPTIRGGQFNRYFCPIFTNEYVLYITKDYNPNEAPNIHKYLTQNKKALITKSVEKRTGNRDWHILFRARYEELFRTPKIIFRQTGDKIIAAKNSNTEYYCINSVHIAKVRNQYQQLLDYFIGILNSKLITFFYREISQEKGRVMAEVKPQRIRSLPIRILEDSEHSRISNLSKNIQYLLKNTSNKPSDEEKKTIKLNIKEIDNLIYELYNLTENEISIVEESTRK